MHVKLTPQVCDMQEDKFAKKALQLLGTAAQDGTLASMTSSLTPAPDRNKGKFLFDLVSCHHFTMANWQYKARCCVTFMQRCAMHRHYALNICDVLPDTLYIANAWYHMQASDTGTLCRYMTKRQMTTRRQPSSLQGTPKTQLHLRRSDIWGHTGQHSRWPLRLLQRYLEVPLRPRSPPVNIPRSSLMTINTCLQAATFPKLTQLVPGPGQGPTDPTDPQFGTRHLLALGVCVSVTKVQWVCAPAVKAPKVARLLHNLWIKVMDMKLPNVGMSI